MARKEPRWRSGPALKQHPPQNTAMISMSKMIVVQGCYTLVIDAQRIPLNAGEEYLMILCWPHRTSRQLKQNHRRLASVSV